MSPNFLASPLTLRYPTHKPLKKLHSDSAMAACVHSSRTEMNPPPKPNPKIDGEGAVTTSYVKYSTRPDPHKPTKPLSSRGRDRERRRAASDKASREKIDYLWSLMKAEATSDAAEEPILSAYYYSSILSRNSMASALANHLSEKLGDATLPSATLYDLFLGVLLDDGEIIRAVGNDLIAVKERDPACISYVHCFLNFKGFLACQSHRIAHNLWSRGRKALALTIQNRVSEIFALDIHPGAKIGRGILLDHATGVVIGETAVIGDDVSILHNVTLGGTGNVCGDRHPKIGDGVLIGAGTCVLGNVRIGDGAKVGAGSVVLKDVPERTTAVGNPARLIGGRENPTKLDKLPGLTMDQTSHVSEWSDYVI